MRDPRSISRRALLRQSGLGFGSIALTHMLYSQGALAAAARGAQLGSGLRPAPGHFPARAKAVIQLVQNGGPARQLVEAGVRFVQVFPPVKPSFQPWDSHNNTKSEIQAIAAKTEQGATARW